MQHYYGFVYLWFDRHRKMFYLGSHKGRIDDGYTGSGRRFISHYNSRPEDFKRRILEYVIGDLDLLRAREEAWLSLIKPSELNVRYMNQKLTATGGAGPRSIITRAKISKSSTGVPKWNIAQRKAISLRQIGVPKSNGPACSRAKKGKRTGPFNDERKQRISRGKFQKISCDGKIFESGQAAAAYYQIAVTTVSARLRNKNFPDWFKI